MTAQARLLGGRYQVGELLGYGGMAEVHRGRDLRLGRDVAIKMLRTDLARDQTFQIRFRREAQNAASLNHPAIVAVYDTGEERAPTGETLPYIVMEFVNGRTLKEVLAAEGRLMPRRALEICADICAALEFSHRHGIIHRDIKPGNVMLTQTGQVKVMDFGIARALASGATTMTQTSAVIGTAQYLSPEQARGEAVDARSDVYAAGCVLFELLCGHPPFVGDSPVSVAYQHVREEPRPPSGVNREVTPDIDSVVLKALAKNPLNRYQSAGEMRADLLRAAAGRPVLATPVMREPETMAMPTRPISGAGRPMPARVGDARRRSASAWVLAALSALGVLAVVALVAGLILATQEEKATATVPQVIGLSEAQAQETVTANRLQMVVGEKIFTNECRLNLVADQRPTPGATLDENSTVTVFICGGKPTKTIPTGLIGGTYQFAESTLKAAGFKVKRQEVDNEAPKDQVVGLSPGQGERVAEGAEVTVQVSLANIKPVPNVVGRTAAQAKELIEDAGFRVRVENGPVVPDSQVGVVTEQSPQATSKQRIGTFVTIKVGVAAPEPTETPDPSPSAGG